MEGKSLFQDISSIKKVKAIQGHNQGMIGRFFFFQVPFPCYITNFSKTAPTGNQGFFLPAARKHKLCRLE